MSIEFWAIPKEVASDKSLSMQAKMVYGILYTRKNGDNISWPGQEYIANGLGISRRSVIRHLQELEENGFISKKRVGKRATNRYTICDILSHSRKSRCDNPVTSDVTTVSHGDVTDVSLPIEREENKEIREDIYIQKIPSEQALSLFTDTDVQKDFVGQFEKTGLDDKFLTEELNMFVLYWTEPTLNGKKQRWQTQKTFEAKRRFFTWLNNSRNFYGRNKPIQKSKSVVL